MSLPNLAALALAPSALGEDTTLMTQGWEELFEQLHDPRIPSEIADKIRKEAAPPPDPVPTLDISPTTRHPGSDDLVTLPLDATGTINAKLYMYHFFHRGDPPHYFHMTNSVAFTFRLPASTEAAKKMQRYWNTFDDLGKSGAKFAVTTTEEQPPIPPNTVEIRFDLSRDIADDEKLLRMFATVCPMTFGTMIAALRVEYVNQVNLKRWGPFGPPTHVYRLAQKLEMMWKAWVGILKTMPVGSGETKRDDSWKAEKAEEIARAEWAQRHGA